MKIDKEIYDQIAELIHSDESPVGIDAKKKHSDSSQTQWNRKTIECFGKSIKIRKRVIMKWQII